MSVGHALKRHEVEFEDPVQITTAKISRDVFVPRRSSSGDDPDLIARASYSHNVGFATTGTVIIDTDIIDTGSSQEQLSFTLPLGIESPNIPIEGGELLPIYLELAFYTEGNLFRFENEDLSLFVSGFTMEELMQELYEHIALLWTEYALEDDAKLAPSGRKLKYCLLERFEQIE